MQIAEFPIAIASLQHEILTQEQVIRNLQANVDRLSLEIEEMIAFDASLTNEAKRKAMKTQLMSGEVCQSAMKQLQVAKDDSTRMSIQLELLRNQFAVAKLDRRMTLVRLELTAA